MVTNDKWVEVLRTINEHVHSVQKVAPSGVAGILVTSHGDAWTLGDFSNDIIATDFVPLKFDIHGVDVQAPSANANFELVLYYGAGDIECGRITFTRTNPTLFSRPSVIQTPILPPGSRVRAKLMDSGGGASCTVKVWYHTYL